MSSRKVPNILPDLNQICNFSSDFYGSPSIKFQLNLPVGTTLIYVGRWTKVNGAFRDCENAPKNVHNKHDNVPR
jgi:hypothetical protein